MPEAAPLVETSPGAHGSGKNFGQYLDRYLSTQLCILGTIHFSHSSGTKRREDLVWTESRSVCKSHIGSVDFVGSMLGRRIAERKGDWEGKSD